MGSVSFLAIAGCQPSKPIAQPSPKNSPPLESHLTLNKATLEQTNAKGESLWKIQVENAVYTPDRKNAQLSKIKGNLFTDGKLVLKVSADKGEIQQDGELVILRENIIAIDPRNKAIIKSNEVEWRPKESLLLVRNNLKGSHPQLEVTAKEGKYETRQQRLDLSGNVVGFTKDTPQQKKPPKNPNKKLQLKAEHLFWLIPQQKVLNEKLMTVSRFQDQVITDQVITKKAELQLNNKLLHIQENVDFKSLKPPLQIAATALTWQYDKRLVSASQPIQIIDYEQQITLTGNQGWVDLNQNLASLTGGTKGISQGNQATLFANQLTWNITNQTLEALGNVIYEQTQSPKFNLTGDRAVGILQNNSVIVTSNNRQERVVTEIYPESR
ncbi:MAG: LPS export ABC transporter periplasmic protein LptC [Snowella sp.]|nr:LPS export ABC transporter periplasmic protein LptC [Snowella sp.]